MRIKTTQKVWYGSPERLCYVLEYNPKSKNVLIAYVAVREHKHFAFWVNADELKKVKGGK